jgi:prepilin-type N-terminal cleavage/methylation domain-containing protein
MANEHGFSLVEMMISMGIMLVLLAATMGSFNDSLSTNEQATLIADLEQNLRAGANLLVQDCINAGWGIPTGGVPIPSGNGAVPVVRPGPPGTNYTFAPALTLAAVNPGAALGPRGNGRLTDIVNLLFADNLLPLNQSPLNAVANDGSSITVSAATPITGVSNAIRAGDLIALSNALGNTLQYVTGVNGQTISFGRGDPLNLNQPNAPQGSITQMKSGNTFPPTTATRVWLITYYLEVTTDPAMPRLIRRVNGRAGSTVALVLDDLQLSYDLVDGVTNPANIKTPIAPNSPNQIRKITIFLSGRSSSRIRATRDFLRHNLTTQVSFRSLSFIDRYR